MTAYKSLYISKGIFELWHGKTWDDYEGDFYKKQIRKFVEEESDMNVLLYGNNGTGKTMLMNLAFKDLLHSGNNVYIYDFRVLVQEYFNGFGSSEQFNELLNCDYLGIDDLGKEFSNSGVSKELITTVLDYTLRHRYHRQLPTWITSNITLSEIKTIYGDHIASLLKRSSVAISITGKDYGDNLFRKITK